jgi:hypothetical protein
VRRPAAGQPGDRPTGDTTAGRRRTTSGPTRAVCRAAVPLLLLAPAIPATAGPAAAAPASADATAPVQVSVDQFEPRSVTPTSTITISGTLTNTGDETITKLALRLQRGQLLTSRDELTAADRDPDPDTAVVAPFTPLQQVRLEPGDSTPFSYSLPAAALQMQAAGVYPVLLNANGSVSGGERRVGELATYLVQPAAPSGKATVGWLWPLADRPHRDAGGHFTDDALTREIGTNGRLDRVLSVVERLPRPSAGQSAPPVPVTITVDPALVEALQVMAAGPYTVGAGNTPGGGTQAAAAFLGRLKAVAADQQVVALPYGDVDPGAVVGAGLGDVLTRSLPGTPAGTAAAPAAGTTAEQGAQTGAGAQILTAALGTRPRTDLAWLPEGSTAPPTLAVLTAGGVGTVVVPPTALTGSARALGTGGPAAARTTVPTPTGTLPALVGDTGLGALTDPERTPGGARIAEQRYLAELDLVAAAAPADPAAAPTVLVSPPREVDPDVDGVEAMMTDAAQQSWLAPGSLDQLAAGPAVPTGKLAAATPAPTLDATGMAAVASAVTARDDLAAAASGDPAAALAADDAAIARTASTAWRGDTAGFRAAAHGLAETIGRLRDEVALVAPADGTYSLASSDAPLVLTVRNDLPFAVSVLLKLSTRGAGGLELGDIGRQVLAPGSRTTLQVPTQVRRSGGFTVVATVTTPSGRPLGDPVQVKVRSTAYGSVSLVITLGAALLLGLLFLRRLVRFVLRRHGRHDRPDDGIGGAPEGAAVPLPPTRSPV